VVLIVADATRRLGSREAGKATPAIGRTWPLIDAPDAVRHLGEGHPRGKSVIAL
jgi:hypothetical protein